MENINNMESIRFLEDLNRFDSKYKDNLSSGNYTKEMCTEFCNIGIDIIDKFSDSFSDIFDLSNYLSAYIAANENTQTIGMIYKIYNIINNIKLIGIEDAKFHIDLFSAPVILDAEYLRKDYMTYTPEICEKELTAGEVIANINSILKQ